jgi:hypothetical protein
MVVIVIIMILQKMKKTGTLKEKTIIMTQKLKKKGE